MAIGTSGLSVPQLGGGGGINSDIYGNKNAPAPLTISDMLDIQKKGLDVQKQKATQESDIEGKLAQNKKLQMAAESAGLDLSQQKANIARGVYGQYLNDPDFINGNSDAMVNKLNNARKFLQGMGLTPDDEGQGHDNLVALAKQDPKQAFQAIRNGVQAAGGNAAQYQSLQNFQNAPVQNPVPPEGGVQGTPTGTMQAPQQTGAQGQTNNAVTLPAHSQPEKLNYPVRQAGQAYAPLPSEPVDLASGQKFRQDLSAGATNLTGNRDNINNVIKEANEIDKAATFPETGPIGAIKRRFAELTGDAKYQELSKDLAKVQVENMRALGTLNTNEGLEAQAAANGKVGYSPAVLRKQAEKARADMTNIEMKNRAVNQFYPKYGDNNAKTFQNEWAKNADRKIFQVINIGNDNNLSAKEKADRVKEIIGTNPDDIKTFNEKYNNLRKLEATGKL